jgi:N-acetylmuramoyl-L-alanine amidase
MSVIVIDPGHGGSSVVGNSSPNNATGPAGTEEKNVTLDIAVRIGDALNGSGHTVLLTRNSDVNLGLNDRAAVAADNNADAFLSVHLNGSTDPSVQGSETWVHSVSTDDSRLLAASVQQRLVGATGYSDRGVKSKGLGVLSLAYQNPNTACCLAEISFLTDPSDESRLQNATYKDSLAMALAQALLDYVNHSTSVTPATPTPEGDPGGNADG